MIPPDVDKRKYLINNVIPAFSLDSQKYASNTTAAHAHFSIWILFRTNGDSTFFRGVAYQNLVLSMCLSKKNRDTFQHIAGYLSN